jgi:succinate dehydrogenase / fumarate reductase cytochrome b subunit
VIDALALYRTSIGKKAVMAVTGIILFAYVFVHMLGNLKIFTGAEHLNAYAIWLREVAAPFFAHEQVLWLIRLVLLVAVVLHIVAAYQVTRQDLAGRPVRYAQRKDVASTYAARTMRWGGVILGLFIIYHLLHLTTGTLHPSFGGHEQVYNNLVVGFRNPLVAGVYIVAMIALALHLYHGVWSFAQTLGWRNAGNDRAWRGFALISAIVIAGGNISVPVAVLLGLVR